MTSSNARRCPSTTTRPESAGASKPASSTGLARRHGSSSVAELLVTEISPRPDGQGAGQAAREPILQFRGARGKKEIPTYTRQLATLLKSASRRPALSA